MKQFSSKIDTHTWQWVISIIFACLFLAVFLLAIGTIIDFEVEKALKSESTSPRSVYWMKIASKLFQSIGALLIAYGVLSVTLGYFTKKNLLAAFSGKIQESLESHFDRSLNGGIRHGFYGFNDKFDLHELLEHAERDDVVYWLDTYNTDFATNWTSIIKSKIEKGVKFKFLALDPDSESAKLRAEEIGGRFESSFKPELEIFIKDLLFLSLEANKKKKGAVEIRLYDGLLGIPVYILTRRDGSKYAMSSFYLREATAVNVPHILWNQRQKGVIDRFLNYFDYKWGKATIMIDKDGNVYGSNNGAGLDAESAYLGYFKWQEGQRKKQAELSQEGTETRSADESPIGSSQSNKINPNSVSTDSFPVTATNVSVHDASISPKKSESLEQNVSERGESPKPKDENALD